MKSRLYHNVIMTVFVTAMLCFIMVMVAGCYTEDKARKQHTRAIDTYPEIEAESCRDKYPVTSRTDSSGYKASMAVIDSLQREISDAAVITETERAALLEEIERARALIQGPCNCDSLSEPLFRLAAKEKRRGDELERINRELAKAAANVKPIRDTVIDKAALHAAQLVNKDCQDAKDRAIRLLEAKTAEAKDWQQKAKNRFWMLLGLGAVSILGFVFLIRKKVVKP